MSHRNNEFEREHPKDEYPWILFDTLSGRCQRQRRNRADYDFNPYLVHNQIEHDREIAWMYAGSDE